MAVTEESIKKDSRPVADREHLVRISVASLSRGYTAIVDVTGARGSFSTIQEAIDFVNNLGGGTVYVRNGTYVQTTDVTLYSNVVILGEDRSNTIIDFNSGRFGLLGKGTAGTHKENIHLGGFTIKNSVDWETGVVELEYLDGFSVQNIRLIDNNDAAEGAGSGIEVDNCTIGDIERNYSNNSNLVNIGGTSDQITVASNLSVSAYDTPYKYGGAATDNIVFTANVADNPGADGFRIDGSGSQFIGNRAVGCTSNGIRILNTSNQNVITNNFLSAGAGADDGIVHDNATRTCDNNIISNNILIGTWAKGIYLVNSDKNIVQGNNVVSSTVGIELTNTCDRNIVSGNHLEGCTTPLTDNGTNTETGGGNITA